MRKFGLKFAGFIALLLIGIVDAHAESIACPDQFLNATPPVLTRAQLQAKTKALCFSEFAVLHSGVTRTPLWSAEHLTRDRLDAAEGLKRPRGNAFHAEPRLPKSQRAELKDYARSGYDRGHMSPNGDMSTPEAQHESFSLANMVPQDPCNNEVLWEGVESAVRDLAAKDGELYVVTGPAFHGSTLKSLNGRVLVPTDVFKAIYDPKRNEAGVYLAPNDASLTWKTLSVGQLRDLVGIDAFPPLAESVKAQPMALPSPPIHNECRVSR